MTARSVFTLTLVACSGQAAPVGQFTGPPPELPRREVYLTPDAPSTEAFGAECGPAGAPCGSTGTCVEQLDRDVCLPSCRSNADCRANEGYACDPVWHGCGLPNTATIAAPACPPPVGLGRDLAFGTATAIGVRGEPRQPAAVLTDDGGLVVVSENHAPNSIEVRRMTGAGMWSPAIDALGHGVAPAIARDGTKLHAVWANHEAVSKIEFATSGDRGATWSTPITVEDPADCVGQRGHCVDHPIVVVGADPAKQGATIVYVGYFAGDGLRVRASRDGAKFGPATKTALLGVRGALAVDVKGVLYAIGLGGRMGIFGSADHRIDFTLSTDGGRTFARPQLVSRFGETLPIVGANPSIVVDSTRKWIYVGYARGGRDGKWDIALAAYKQGAAQPGWKRARLGDDPACAMHLDPDLALDPVTGQLHVAWYDSRGLRFAHASCTEGLGVCRQLGRINDAPFAGLSLANHGPTAVGESQALVVDWSHRALHAVWTQSITLDSRPVARIYHTRAKLPMR